MGVLETDTPCDDMFRMEMPRGDVGDAVRHFGRTLTRPIRSVMPTPYICRSGTGVVSLKSPYIRWQMPLGSAERNASRMLASVAAASTTIGNSPIGSITRPFGAS